MNYVCDGELFLGTWKSYIENMFIDFWKAFYLGRE